jgi:hypothetical protein
VIAPTLDLRGADLGPGLEAPSVAPAGPVGPGGLQSFGAATVLEAVPEHRQTPPLRVEVPASARPKGWGATPRWTRWAFVIGIACWLAAGAVTLARGLST